MFVCSAQRSGRDFGHYHGHELQTDDEGDLRREIRHFQSDQRYEVTADVPTGAVTGKIAVTTKGGSATSVNQLYGSLAERSTYVYDGATRK